MVIDQNQPESDVDVVNVCISYDKQENLYRVDGMEATLEDVPYMLDMVLHQGRNSGSDYNTDAHLVWDEVAYGLLESIEAIDNLEAMVKTENQVRAELRDLYQKYDELMGMGEDVMSEDPETGDQYLGLAQQYQDAIDSFL